MSTRDSRSEACEEMRRGHSELLGVLAELTQLLADRAVDISEISTKLSGFARKVGEHFECEETSGCFANMVSIAPRVSERVEKLIAEHAQMRSEIGEIVSCATGCPGEPADWEKIAADFDDFSTRLKKHEGRENELLQEVFSDDIGAKD